MDGNLVVFGAFESRQGNTDMNGDGDALDRVLHIHDTVTATTVNLGQATDGFVNPPDGNLLSFLVKETAQDNTDLNGDGDVGDMVLHVADLSIAVASGCLDALCAEVEALDLHQGIKNSLTAKCQAAQKALAKDNVISAINALSAFINEVEAQRGKKITEADADALIAAEVVSIVYSYPWRDVQAQAGGSRHGGIVDVKDRGGESQQVSFQLKAIHFNTQVIGDAGGGVIDVQNLVTSVAITIQVGAALPRLAHAERH